MLNNYQVYYEGKLLTGLVKANSVKEAIKRKLSQSGNGYTFSLLTAEKVL